MSSPASELKFECADVHMRSGFARKAALVGPQSIRRAKQSIITCIKSGTATEQSHSKRRTAIVRKGTENRISRNASRTREVVIHAVGEARTAVRSANEIVT